MRIIGHIEHPHLKITVFKMDNRISVKFENALYEQTYKFGLDERIDSLDAVQMLVDANFAEDVSACFQHMHRTRMTAFGKMFPLDNQLVFEEII